MKGRLQLVVASLLGSTAVQGLPQAVPQAINPWDADCPVPSNFTITDFTYLKGKGDYPTFNISYGDGTFRCPVRPNAMTFFEGWTIMNCDDDGLVQVTTDGGAYISVRQKYWCPSIPQPNNSYATLQSFVSSTPFPADFFKCTDIPNISNRLSLCEQAQPEFVIPVEFYGIGGPIDFKPLDINGTLLPYCPSIPGVSPIVTDVLNCNATSPGKPKPYPTGSVSVSIPVPTISLPNITVFPTGTGTASAGIPVRTSSDWQLKGRWSQKLGRRARK